MEHSTAAWRHWAGACDMEKQPGFSASRASHEFSDTKFHLDLCVFQRNKTLGLLVGTALKLTSFHPGLLCFEPIKYDVIKISPKGHRHPKRLRTQSLHLWDAPRFLWSVCGLLCSSKIMNLTLLGCAWDRLSQSEWWDLCSSSCVLHRDNNCSQRCENVVLGEPKRLTLVCGLPKGYTHRQIQSMPVVLKYHGGYFPGGSVVQNPPRNIADVGSTRIRKLRCHMLWGN